MENKFLTDNELEQLFCESGGEENCEGSDSDEELLEYEADEKNHENVQDNIEINAMETDFESEETGFNWKKNGDFQPILHDFNLEKSVCKINLTSDVTVLECFELFINEEIVQQIVNQTNLFEQQSQEKQVSLGTQLHTKKWKEVEIDEFYCFVALSFLMPQIKKLNLKDYWANDALIATPIFGQVLSRDRYFYILKYLHFVDNTDTNNRDKLRKIRIVVNHLRSTYQNVFYPFKNVCIDESLMLFKGRLHFKQYMPSKRRRFGIKLFILCDCETGYILNFIIYTDAESDIKEYDRSIGKSGNIVLTLMDKYLDSGHMLYTDNWYTSPILYNVLHVRKTNACGTVKPNRKELPKMTEKLAVGEVVHYSTTNMLALKWQDRREVRMLSTCHTARMLPTGKQDIATKEDKMKPECILRYNDNMGAVDKTDMLQSSIESVRKCLKWYL